MAILNKMFGNKKIDEENEDNETYSLRSDNNSLRDRIIILKQELERLRNRNKTLEKQNAKNKLKKQELTNLEEDIYKTFLDNPSYSLQDAAHKLKLTMGSVKVYRSKIKSKGWKLLRVKSVRTSETMRD
jgi:predicted RNase H-like nuclease (RuvC/YqgF family)